MYTARGGRIGYVVCTALTLITGGETLVEWYRTKPTGGGLIAFNCCVIITSLTLSLRRHQTSATPSCTPPPQPPPPPPAMCEWRPLIIYISLSLRRRVVVFSGKTLLFLGLNTFVFFSSVVLLSSIHSVLVLVCGKETHFISRRARVGMKRLEQGGGGR